MKKLKLTNPTVEQFKTATEMMMVDDMKRTARLNYKMAKALVEGKVDSRTLRWAEEVFETQKEIFED